METDVFGAGEKDRLTLRPVGNGLQKRSTALPGRDSRFGAVLTVLKTVWLAPRCAGKGTVSGIHITNTRELHTQVVGCQDVGT